MFTYRLKGYEIFHQNFTKYSNLSFELSKQLEKLTKKCQLTNYESKIINWEILITLILESEQKIVYIDSNIISDYFKEIVIFFEKGLLETNKTVQKILFNTSSTTIETKANVSITILYTKFWTFNIEVLVKICEKICMDCVQVIWSVNDCERSKATEQVVLEQFLRIFYKIFKYFEKFITLVEENDENNNNTRYNDASLLQAKYQFQKTFRNLSVKIKNEIIIAANSRYDMEIQKIGKSNTKSENLLQIVAIFGSVLVRQLKLQREFWLEMCTGIDLNIFEIIYEKWTLNFIKTFKPILLQNISIPNKKLEKEEHEYIYKIYLQFRELLKYNVNENSKKDLQQHICCFLPYILQWIQIINHKNIIRIQKAIEIDNFMIQNKQDFLDTTVRWISSSAIDVSEMLMKINEFWFEINWPIPEEAYCLIILLIKVLFKSVNKYISKTHLHYEKSFLLKSAAVIPECISNTVGNDNKRAGLDEKLIQKFIIIINNIKQIQNSYKLLIQKFNISTLLVNLSIQNGKQVQLKEYKRDILELIDGLDKKLEFRTWVILRRICCQLVPKIFQTNIKNCNNFSMENILTTYNLLINNLINHIMDPEISSKIVEYLWNSTLNYIEKLIIHQKSLLIEKQQESIKSLLYNLETIFSKFNNRNINNNPLFLKLAEYLRLHGSSTAELIIEYLTIRFTEQLKLNWNIDPINQLLLNTEYNLSLGTLKLEILHGILNDHLKSASHNLYVKLQIITKDMNKTKQIYYYTNNIKANTKYAVFEDLFTIKIRPEIFAAGGIIRFWLKSKNIVNCKKILGESFLPLDIIPRSVNANDSRQIGNNYLIRLALCTANVKSCLKSKILSVLHKRKFKDKSAYYFAKGKF